MNVFSDTGLSEQPNEEDHLVMRFRTCFICLRLGVILQVGFGFSFLKQIREHWQNLH